MRIRLSIGTFPLTQAPLFNDASENRQLDLDILRQLLPLHGQPTTFSSSCRSQDNRPMAMFAQ